MLRFCITAMIIGEMCEISTVDAGKMYAAALFLFFFSPCLHQFITWHEFYLLFCCLTNFSYFYGILIHFVWNNLGMAWLNFIPFTVQPNSDFEGNKITMIAECRDLLCSSKLFQSTSILQISYSNFLAASIHKVQ